MKIKKEVISRLVDHAKKEAPLEACGYLAVKKDVIVDIYTLTNIDKSEEHFSFDPKEQFKTVKDARSRGLVIGAVYHSHPSSPARPSGEDIKLAYDPDILYVIVSLAQVKEDIKAFTIKNSKVNEVNLEVVND